MSDTPSLRRATPEDLHFVHSSWHSSYWSAWAHKHIDRDVYHEHQDARISLALARSEVYVAYFEAAPTEVLGWVAFEPYRGVLHYAYVKGPYRRHGIGTGLVAGLKLRWHTHNTNERGKLFLRKLGIRFNPYKENP